MSDIKLHLTDGGVFDVRVVSNDLEHDEGLETAIIVSLFCDSRATAEELPVEEQSRRGWWGDVAGDEDDLIGSKLWLLRREKITADVLRRAKEYCEEALAWLIEDGVAESVAVTTERGGLYKINIGIEIARPQEQASRRFSYVWAAA